MCLVPCVTCVACNPQVNYSPGDVIIRQGDYGDAFYLIKKGKVLVTSKASSQAADTSIGELKEGDFFGEMARFRPPR